jgi:hypothetical protein
VAAVAHFSGVLAGHSSVPERRDALRWIVHLVADLHQPLHAGDGWDRGGNDFAVRLGRRRQPTNLHRVWDTEVVRPLLDNGGVAMAAREFDSRITPQEALAWRADLDPASWATESSREARAIYSELRRRPTERSILQLPSAYPQLQRVRVSLALERAAVRLAALLDDIASRRIGESSR